MKSKLFLALTTNAFVTSTLLAGCASGDHSTPSFNSRKEADEACYRDLKAHIESEIKKSSDSRFMENWTPIKSKHEEYAILDFGCKPVFAKGSTTGKLAPYYFYLDGGSEYTDGSVQLQVASNLKPEDASKNGTSNQYSYPLDKAVAFESLPPTGPQLPLEMPYSSIMSDSVSQGVALGAVMRTCRDLYKHNKITFEEAENEIKESRMFLEKFNADAPVGPLSSNGQKLSLKVLNARWEKCKSEKGGYR